MMKEKSKWITNKYIVAVLATFCALLWGSAYPGIKLGYQYFGITQGSSYDKILFAGFRFLFAGLAVIIFMSVINKKLLYPQKSSTIPKILLLGLTYTTIHYIFFYIGLSNTAGGKSAILQGTTTLFTVILSAIFIKNDKLTVRKTAGCILGFLGIVIINLNTEFGGLEMSLQGEGFLLLASLFFGIGSIMSKWAVKEEDSSTVVGYQLIIGGLFLIMTGLLGGGHIPVVSIEGILILCYLVFLSSVVYSLWTMLLNYNKVSSVTIYYSFVPVFGVILSGILLGEEILNWHRLIALALVFSAIFIVNSATDND